MKKTIAELLDELTIVNIKIFNLVELISSDQHTLKDAKKVQDLNSYRSQLKNAISEYYQDRQEVKIGDARSKVDISIFTRPSYIGNRHPEHIQESTVQRVSSRIRGDEIAEYIGAKLNPTDGFEEDICIYVKPKDLDKVRDGDYLDYLDGKNMWLLLKDRPKIKVIAASKVSFEFLKKNLKNEIFLIPQHHLNWERIKRKKGKITTCGYIGGPLPSSFNSHEEIGNRLNAIGFNYKTCFDFKTRQDAVDLYKSVDLFINGDWAKDSEASTKIPTKIINAASFAVPTIAYLLEGYQEIEGYYVHATNIDEMLAEVEKFKNEEFYNAWSNKVDDMAEKYHISKIAELYKALK